MKKLLHACSTCTQGCLRGCCGVGEVQDRVSNGFKSGLEITHSRFHSVVAFASPSSLECSPLIHQHHSSLKGGGQPGREESAYVSGHRGKNTYLLDGRWGGPRPSRSFASSRLTPPASRTSPFPPSRCSASPPLLSTHTTLCKKSNEKKKKWLRI